MANNNGSDPLWYKDAIIYELHVKAFCDRSGDGIGDFRGLIDKLDYIKDLGVTAIWLLPFYPSPQKDDGYDIADYRGVHPDYGTLRDFRQFVREAHNRGLKVFTELLWSTRWKQLFQAPAGPKRGFPLAAGPLSTAELFNPDLLIRRDYFLPTYPAKWLGPGGRAYLTWCAALFSHQPT